MPAAILLVSTGFSEMEIEHLERTVPTVVKIYRKLLQFGVIKLFDLVPRSLNINQTC